MNDPHNRMYSHDLRVLSELSACLYCCHLKRKLQANTNNGHRDLTHIRPLSVAYSHPGLSLKFMQAYLFTTKKFGFCILEAMHLAKET